MRLVVITPARNEVTMIGHLVQAMRNQLYRPIRWVVVDDGSSDGTGALIEAETRDLDWVRVVHQPDRGFYQRGEGVVRAFYAGLQALQDVCFDLVAKVDADLSLDPDYFEFLVQAFESDSKLGISSGQIYELRQEEWVPDVPLPEDFVRGACKVYRLTCLESIGGLIPHKGWDGIDNVKALLAGWHVHRFDNLKVKHHRPIGAKEGRIRGRYYAGADAYYTGSRPLVIWRRSLYAMRRPPFFLAGCAMLAGYFGNAFLRRPRVDDPAVIAFVRARESQVLRERITHW